MSDPLSREKAPTDSVSSYSVEFGDEATLPPPPDLTLDQERKVYRKIDLRLMPILSLMYIVASMDGGNIGNAKVAGLATQLNLVGNEFNISLIISVVAYCVCQCPAKYPQLVCTRVFLGAFEAGLFLGVVYYLTLWYPRHALQFRIGLFFGGASLALAFSGLLAFTIGYMNGIRGLEGWSWIFILEGSATVVVGILAAFVLVDFPATAGFLTPEERAYVVRKKKYDNSTVGEEEAFAIRYVWAALLDWQLWLYIIIYMSVIFPLSGIALFLPSIITGFGYSTSGSQLLTVPVYAFAAIVALGFGYYSDKLRRRFPFIFAGQLLLLVGLLIEISPAPRGVKYFGIYVSMAGAVAAVPDAVSWLGNNLAGQCKRGVGMAVHVGLGNSAILISSNVFRTQDAPRYIIGYSVEIIFLGIGICSLDLAVTMYTRINVHRDRSALAYGEKGGHGYTAQELREMGDLAPDFRYTI